jgi:hypothetical protein
MVKPVLVMDIFEGKIKGQDVQIELEQYLIVARQNLVPLGLADYFWMGANNLRYTLEHKTALEFLQTMGNRLDEQLRKHTQNADVAGLIIEGIISPIDNGCEVWQRKGKGFDKAKRASSRSYQAVMGYIWGLQREGVQVYLVPDWKALCRAVAEFVYNTQKTEHKTLQSYVKANPIILDPGLSDEERMYVKTLMGLDGARIGERTAKKILAAHQTPYKFFVSDIDQAKNKNLQATFTKMIRALGR